MSICTIFKVAISKDGPFGIETIPGVLEKGNNILFITRYTFWRKCAIRFCFILSIFLTITTVDKAVINVLDWKSGMGVFPAAFRTHMLRFVIGNLTVQVLLSVSIIYIVWCLTRAIVAGNSDYNKCCERLLKGWATKLILPYVIFMTVPFAALFRWDLLRTDVCAMTMSSFLSQGATVRSAFAHFATASPELAAIGLVPAPSPTDFEQLREWEGYKWCRANYKIWERRFFGPRWVRAAKRSGMPSAEDLKKPVNGQPGVAPQVLLAMAAMTGVLVDATFSTCGKQDPVGGGSDVDGAAKDQSSLFQAEEEEEDYTSWGGWNMWPGRRAPYASSRTKDKWPLSAFTEPSAFTRHWTTPNASFVVDPKGQILQQPGASLLSLQDLDEGLHERNTGQSQMDPDAAIAYSQRVNPAFHVVCGVFGQCLNFMRANKLIVHMARSALGMTTNKNVFLIMFPGLLGLHCGITMGCCQAKQLLPTSRLPGYLLSIAMIGFLPTMLMIIAMVSQAMGSVLFSLSMLCYATQMTLSMRIAITMVNVESAEEIRATIQQHQKHELIGQLLALFFFIIFVCWYAYILFRGGVGAETIQQIIDEFDVHAFLQQLPLLILDAFVCKFFFQTLMNLVMLDTICRAIFDGLDPKLQNRSAISKRHKITSILKQWRQICPIELPKKKKKKFVPGSLDDDSMFQDEPSDCLECGAQLMEGMDFCITCGKKIEEWQLHPETRVAPDGGEYTRAEFLDFYGGVEGIQMWNSAKQDPLALEEPGGDVPPIPQLPGPDGEAQSGEAQSGEEPQAPAVQAPAVAGAKEAVPF